MNKRLLLILGSLFVSGSLVSATIFTSNSPLSMAAINTGLSVIDVPSGAIKVCGFENPNNTQEFNLLKIANQMKCDEISDLKDHCGCVFQYGGSELQSGEIDDLEAELGYLSEATSTTKQKALNDLGNANAVLNMYGLFEIPRERNTCINQKELNKFKKDIDQNLRESIARNEKIPSLARKDFLNQAETINNFTSSPKNAFVADEQFLNDLSKAVDSKSIFSDPNVGLPGPSLFFKYESTGEINMLTSLPKEMSNPKSCLNYGFDKSQDVLSYLEDPSVNLDKYKDSPLFKVFSQLPADKKLNFSDYLGRLSIAKDHYEAQSKAPLIVAGVDALKKAAETVPIDEFIGDECQRITEQVKYETSSNYSDGKFQPKFLESKKIIAQRNGEVLLEAKDGAENIERISGLRLQYSRKYKEALSGLDEDERKVLLTEKLFNFSKLLCGKLKIEDQMAYTISYLNNLEDNNNLLKSFEEAQGQIEKANIEIENLKLELVNIDRTEVGLSQSIASLEIREKELTEQLVRAKSRKGRNKPIAIINLLKKDLDSTKESLAAAKTRYNSNKERKTVLVAAIEASEKRKETIVSEAGKPLLKRPAKLNIEDPGPIIIKPVDLSEIELPTILVYDDDKPLFPNKESDLDLDTNLKLSLFDNYEVVEPVKDPVVKGGEPVIVKTLERIENKKKVYTGTTIGKDKVTLEDSSVGTNRTIVSEMKRVETTREALSDSLAEVNEKNSKISEDEENRINESIKAGLDLIGDSVVVQRDIITQAGPKADVAPIKAVVRGELERTRKFVAENQEVLEGASSDEHIASSAADGLVTDSDGNLISNVMFEGGKTRQLLTSIGDFKDVHLNSKNGVESVAALPPGFAGGIGQIFTESYNSKEGDRKSENPSRNLLSSRTLGLSDKFGEAEELGMALASGVKNVNSVDSDANKVMEKAQALLAERGYDVPETSYSESVASSPKEVKQALESKKVELKRKNKIQRQIARDMQIENMGIAREVAQTKDAFVSKNVEKELKIKDVVPEQAVEAPTPSLDIPNEVAQGPIENREENKDKIGAPRAQVQSKGLSSAEEAKSLGSKIKEKINTVKEKKKAAKVAAAPVKKPAVSSGGSAPKGKASVSSPSAVASGSGSTGAGSPSSRGPASVSGQIVDNSFELGYDRTKAFSSKKFDLTPILEGVDDDLYVRIPSFEAPDGFLRLSEQKREEWVSQQFEESKAQEAVVVFPDGKKLLVKKKN